MRRSSSPPRARSWRWCDGAPACSIARAAATRERRRMSRIRRENRRGRRELAAANRSATQSFHREPRRRGPHRRGRHATAIAHYGVAPPPPLGYLQPPPSLGAARPAAMRLPDETGVDRQHRPRSSEGSAPVRRKADRTCDARRSQLSGLGASVGSGRWAARCALHSGHGHIRVGRDAADLTIASRWVSMRRRCA